MSQSDTCALNANDSLKDTQDIIFSNDPDDTVPLSSAQAAQATSSTTPAGSDTFSMLLKAGHKPAPLTAGAQCSIHTSKPSAHLCDADNACSHPVSSTRKCALSSSVTEQLVKKKVALQLSAPLSDDDGSSYMAGANMDNDTDPGAEDKDTPDVTHSNRSVRRSSKRGVIR
ncbi:uncharacterized protein F5891DRAFT_1192798 [Suillus fuscotomentosus]|uniref:Uncharacterized protein n=1 Tax=Suillus fuscotomentosus TaxID=1912939 RepID=A0AAD4DYZ3_9AGAM|nr:uncharacterized protein F5891DRAFT_1192798 [Suillus fuscotomentosus]KAG1896694.1 hypothetical protein F5891DRAFT_1192798 [Suillus fuscotomentosus]